MRTNGTLLTVCVVLSLAGCAAGANLATLRLGVAPTDVPAARRYVLPTAYAVAAKRAPTIDGVLDEAAWRSAAPLVLGTLTARGRPSAATRVLLLHDNKQLYIA